MVNIRDQEEAHKEQYEQRIKELEAENKQLKSAERVPVVVSCSHEEEISQLQVCISSVELLDYLLSTHISCLHHL